MTAASVSAGTAVLSHCVLNDLSRTAVESKSNRSCNVKQRPVIGEVDQVSGGGY